MVLWAQEFGINPDFCPNPEGKKYLNKAHAIACKMTASVKTLFSLWVGPIPGSKGICSLFLNINARLILRNPELGVRVWSYFHLEDRTISRLGFGIHF